MKDEALKFIEEHTKYRYIKTIGLDGCYSRGFQLFHKILINFAKSS